MYCVPPKCRPAARTGRARREQHPLVSRGGRSISCPEGAGISARLDARVATACCRRYQPGRLVLSSCEGRNWPRIARRRAADPASRLAEQSAMTLFSLSELEAAVPLVRTVV